MDNRVRVENQLFYFIPSLMVLSVWTAYMILSERWFLLTQHWELTLTMVFGSLVAGATSEGGGAVAFPVFTKLLQVPPHIARTFSLAIQAVGMGTASVVIFKYRVRVSKEALIYASLGGAVGIILGTLFVAPNLKPAYFKIAFTVLTVSFGFVLVVVNRVSDVEPFNGVRWGGRGGLGLLAVAGLLGGMFTSVVGTGIDFLTFSVLVLYFNVSEKVATPTSVVLMAINSLVGLSLHVTYLDTFKGAVVDYWLVCIPVVIFGAPVGAMISSRVSRENIIRFLLFLILVELISTILLVKLDMAIGILAMSFQLLMMAVFYVLYRGRVRQLQRGHK